MRPNFLIITSDQQRTDTASCYGAGWMRTPNLQRLADGGVCFDRAYCSNPVCMPSRVSLFSGQMVSRHGVWNVGVNTPPEVPLLSHYLKDAGYHNHYIGKAHFQAGGWPHESWESAVEWEKRFPPGLPQPYYGFDRIELAIGHTLFGVAGDYGAWVRSQCTAEEFERYARVEMRSEFSFGGEAYDWELPLRLHNSVWTADRAVDFLRGYAGEQPFLLSVGFQDPHHPHALPRDFTDKPNPDDVPLPDYREGELDDKPPHFLEARHNRLEESAIRGAFPVAGQAGAGDFSKVSPNTARLGRSYYYGMVQLIDQQLGRILDALDEIGRADNTFIIFTSDHGELLGDHGLWMKGPFLYEQLIRVPTIMRWPRGFAGGRRTSAFWSHIDLVPTMLNAAGLPVPANVDGIDSLPVLRGDAESVRGDVLVECIDSPSGLRLKTLVTANRKLTWYCDADYGELYDLERDPGEKVNLWHNPIYTRERAELLGRLLTILEPLEKRAPRHAYA